MATLHYEVRPATPADIAYIVALSARVQDALTIAGSLQQLGPLAATKVARQVAATTAYLLLDTTTPIGSVFIEPLLDYLLPNVPLQPLRETGRPLYFLSKLMLEPAQQGRGLSSLLLDAAKEVTRDGLLLLDCWAGNTKLRTLYTAAGFSLYGIFAEGDYQIALMLYPPLD